MLSDLLKTCMACIQGTSGKGGRPNKSGYTRRSILISWVPSCPILSNRIGFEWFWYIIFIFIYLFIYIPYRNYTSFLDTSAKKTGNQHTCIAQMICVRSNFWELLQYLFPNISLMLNLPYVRLLSDNRHQNRIPGWQLFFDSKARRFTSSWVDFPYFWGEIEVGEILPPIGSMAFTYIYLYILLIHLP